MSYASARLEVKVLMRRCSKSGLSNWAESRCLEQLDIAAHWKQIASDKVKPKDARVRAYKNAVEILDSTNAMLRARLRLSCAGLPYGAGVGEFSNSAAPMEP
jgi:acyl CoA:acetate/3-ketoacid CoA transferase alpha subunit